MKFSEILAGKKDYRIGFIGGSITEGFGASVPSKRYSSKFVEMLSKRIPEINFTEINAGVGGSPSALGMFRLKKEVLDKQPDMLFIEFAVNDAGYADWLLPYFEGIIRTARRYDPNMPIAVLFSYMHKFNGSSREDPVHVMVGQQRVAKEYGIPCIYMGYDMYDKIEDYGGDNTLFTLDGVHPNDAGYNIYVDSIMRDIFRVDFSFEFPEKPVTDIDYENPDMILCETVPLPEHWMLSQRTLHCSPFKYICCDTPGASISFEFTGTACGLYTRMEKDGGIADVTIDGKNFGKVPFFDQYSLDFDRDCYTIIADELPYGKHTVTLTVRSDKEEKSEGHVARIAAFLVG